MKYLLILLVLVSFTNYASAQTQTSLDDGLYINVQSELRNSDGVLISYLESSKFTHLNLSALYNFLDFETTQGSTSIVNIDGNNYQIIQRTRIITFDSDDVIGSTKLSDSLDGKIIPLARFAHDGLLVVPGDSLQSTWTFVRLI